MIMCAFAESGAMTSMAAAARIVDLKDILFPRPAEECTLSVAMVFRRSVIKSCAGRDLSQVVVDRVELDFFDSCIVGKVVLLVFAMSWVGRISMSL